MASIARILLRQKWQVTLAGWSVTSAHKVSFPQAVGPRSRQKCRMVDRPMLIQLQQDTAGNEGGFARVNNSGSVSGFKAIQLVAQILHFVGQTRRQFYPFGAMELRVGKAILGALDAFPDGLKVE